MTVSGTAVTFYLNGASIGGGGAITVARADTGQPLRMGLRADDFTASVGSMADVRLYNRALSGPEVNALYLLSPTARVSYSAAWFDGIDRQIASANYGAAASFTYPARRLRPAAPSW